MKRIKYQNIRTIDSISFAFAGFIKKTQRKQLRTPDEARTEFFSFRRGHVLLWLCLNFECLSREIMSEM